VLLGLFAFSQLSADLLPRLEEVNIEDALTLNVGGIGNIIAGVDVDGDGLTEIYMVNNNWNDGADEVIPRIYKYERLAADLWAMVWEAIPPTTLVEKQNTWPTLSLTDLDNDGKMELCWGIVNNVVTIANPARIVVYEHAGGDNFGVDNAGVWEPNSSWTITDSVSTQNIRPIDWEIADIDDDGVDEIIFADRKGTTSGMYYGICSVSDIPDAGDGSETWTLESSGLDVGMTSAAENKWDVAVVGNNAYIFSETEISKISWTGTAYEYTALSPIIGGSPNQAALGVDIDGDGTTEIFAPTYDWGVDSLKGVYILKEVADTLQATLVANMSEYWPSGSRGIWGAASGDIDDDGLMDFVMGSRASSPHNGMIFRIEHQGGDIYAAANWELTIIDSAYAVVDLADGGIWSEFAIGNMDEDAGNEVFYASSVAVPYSVEFATTSVSAPVIILDSPNTSVSIEEREVQIADGYKLQQNYPNPFNPSTTITFHIPQNEVVSLSVYDLQGREVATLLNQSMSTGSYDLTWGGLDNNGVQVASGVYVYTLRTSSYTDSKTMLFLK